MSTTENLSTDFLTQDEAAETTASFAVNTTTKAELLSRAKAAIEAGDQSMREAAEALAVARLAHAMQTSDGLQSRKSLRPNDQSGSP